MIWLCQINLKIFSIIHISNFCSKGISSLSWVHLELQNLFWSGKYFEKLNWKHSFFTENRQRQCIKCLFECLDRPWDFCVCSSPHREQTFPLERADNCHYLTFNSEFKADMAERHGPGVGLQLADTADVVIVQVNVHKLLLFMHSAYGSKGRGIICIVRIKNKAKRTTRNGGCFLDYS